MALEADHLVYEPDQSLHDFDGQPITGEFVKGAL